MDSRFKVAIATTCAVGLLVAGYLALGGSGIGSAPATERQKAVQMFREMQEKDEARMLERCSEPFGPGLTEREERNRKWCVSHGHLDPI